MIRVSVVVVKNTRTATVNHSIYSTNSVIIFIFIIGDGTITVWLEPALY